MSALKRSLIGVVAGLALATSLAACSADDSETAQSSSDLVIYSGRSENLIKPLIDRFSAESGINVQVRYAGSPELGAQLLEEGDNTEADVFLSQDAGALGAVQRGDLLAPLPQAQLDKVDARFRSDVGQWVGVSARARVIAYNPTTVPEAEVPRSVFDVTDPKWRGRVGIAPTNASFQAFITGMRVTAGEARAKQFLDALKENEPKTYSNNVLTLEAVDKGEIALGLINHYYLYERQNELGAENVNVRNFFLGNGDPGALVNVAGVGIVKNSRSKANAERFVEFLLSSEAQTYFRDETFEYPVIAGVEPSPGLPPLASIQSPAVDLSDLETLDLTQAMLREAGFI